MRVSDLTYVRNGNAFHGCYFDVGYKPDYPDFGSFFRWFMGSEGPGKMRVLPENVTPAPHKDGQARISGGPSVKSLHAELLKLYPPLPLA